jgi:hypothetical protein
MAEQRGRAQACHQANGMGRSACPCLDIKKKIQEKKKQTTGDAADACWMPE